MESPGLCTSCNRGAEATHRCFECVENICDHCAETHRVLQVFDSHRAVPFGNVTDEVEKCAKHGAALSLFCTETACQHFICPQCIRPEEPHAGHMHHPISDLAEMHRQEFDKKIAPIRQLKERLSHNASHIASCKDEIKRQSQELPEKVQATLQHAITSSTPDLREITKLSDKEAEVLDKNLSDIERASDDIAGLLTFADGLILSATDRDVLKAMGEMSDIERRVARLLKRYSEHGANEYQSYRVTTLLPTADQMTNFIINHAKVVLIKPPDPRKCVYDGPDNTKTNKESCCKVFVMDGNGQPCNTPHDTKVIFRSLTDDSQTGVTQNATVTSAGCYKVLFTPVVRGSYSVEVTVDGTPIAGSPFRMLAILPPRRMGGCPVRVIPNMEGPTRLSFSTDDIHSFAVSESSGKRLRLMITAGDQIGVINYQAQFTSVEYDPDGCLYAVTNPEPQLMKFNKDGEIMKSVGSEGPDQGKFQYPTAICSHNEEVIVADIFNNRLQVFDKDLKFRREFRGDEQFPFLQPRGVAFGILGAMYVADSGNRCIQKFQENKLVLIFGMDKLQCPTAVAVDRSGKYILVSDSDKNMVFVFTTKGKFVHAFGGEGSGAGQFKHPLGLAMDGDGYLWVCDYSNGRLQVF